MFCHQCGKELMEGIKFCPYCGARLMDGMISAEGEKPFDKSENLMTLPLMGEMVSFPETIDLYVEIRKAFEELGTDISQEFADHFYSDYHDMDDFISKFPKNFPDMFKEATDLMNELLSEFHIFGTTREELSPYTEKYCSHTYMELQTVNGQYQEIVGRQEEMQEYRQARKDSRGRLVGGGFGLGGAAKGMMTAGAVNMATGVLHSVGNAIGNMGSAISAANAKDRLFKSGISSSLEYAIKQDILGMHLVTVEIITARTGKKLCKFTEEDQKRANQILEDLKESLIPDESVRVAVVRMLTTYPFDPNYYQMAVCLFPDQLEDLRDFAEFFGFEIDRFYYSMRKRIDPAVEILLEYQDELENMLLEDLNLDEEDLEPLTTDLDDMLGYFENIFADAGEDRFYFFPDEDEKGRSKLNGTRVSYAQYGNETPLILYDSTLGRSGKDGFLITNQHVYLKNNGRPVILPLQDAIEDIHQEENPDNHCNYLYFGDYSAYLLSTGDMVKEEILGDFIELLISLILFLTVMKPKEEDLWEAVARYQQLPEPDIEDDVREVPDEPEKEETDEPADSPKVCYCFECGAENDLGDKYCCECGAELF